jgi:hypothetical protein
MTDSTTTSATPAAESTSTEAPKRTVAQTIEAMVSASGRTAAVSPIRTREGGADGAMFFNSASNELTTQGDTQRLSNDGPVTGTTVAEQRMSFDKQGAEFARIVGRLAECTYDPRTGEPVNTYTGAERQKLILQAEQARHAGDAIQRTITRLEQQNADAAALHAKQNAEATARLAFSQGDPKRAALYDEALARAEAEEAVRLQIASRRAQ